MSEIDVYTRINNLIHSDKYKEFPKNSLYIKHMYEFEKFYLLDIKCNQFSEEINKYFAFYYIVDKADGECREVFLKDASLKNLIVGSKHDFKIIDIKNLYTR